MFEEAVKPTGEVNSLNPFPSLPMDCGVDGLVGNVKLPRDLPSYSVTVLRHTLPYFANLLLIELYAALAMSVGTAPLSDHVGHVFGVCSEEKMVWVDARRVVASVQDKFLIGDCAPKHFPNDTCGVIRRAINFNHSIAVALLSPNPNPAAIVNQYLGPYSIQQMLWPMLTLIADDFRATHLSYCLTEQDGIQPPTGEISSVTWTLMAFLVVGWGISLKYLIGELKEKKAELKEERQARAQDRKDFEAQTNVMLQNIYKKKGGVSP